ncbi:hypothetical protein OC835_001441 [Tilletia horrida]|nr:hypothetical protein OC835_001441 [Tilletia horrida]
MLQLSLGVSALSALLLGVATIYPYYQYKAFHYPASPITTDASPGPQNPPPLHPHLCEYIPELAHCDDIAVHKSSGHAYFTCDDTRLWRDPLRLRWAESVPAGRKGGSIWHLDLNDPFSLPIKLEIQQAPEDSSASFHPAGITVTTANSTQHNASSPDAILLLVSNYPQPHQPGVVDVLVHEPKRSSTALRHHRRLDASHFHANWRGSTPSVSGRDSRLEQRTSGAQLSPWRLSVLLEQYSPPLGPDVPGSAPDLAIPSFFFSSAPVAPPHANLSALEAAATAEPFMHLVQPRMLDYVKDVLLPSHASRAHVSALKPPAHIYNYIANGAVTVPASDGSVAVASASFGSNSAGASALAGFPPIPRAWDGGGERAGRNSSAASLFVLGSAGSKSSVAEHEQHWVRSIPSVMRVFVQSAAYSAAKRLHFGGDVAVAKWGLEDVVAVYTPQYVTFTQQAFGHIQTALANDVLGRYWVAGPEGGFEQARRWLNHLYAVSSGLAPPSQEGRVQRPVTAIHQVTHLYRHGPSVAHPWELERLKGPRDQGMFLPKEFYTTPIFRSRVANAYTSDQVGANAFEPLSIQPAPVSSGPGRVAKQLGFLPTLPTGLEVDHERGWVLVSSVWDERGSARCEIPKNWAER